MPKWNDICSGNLVIEERKSEERSSWLWQRSISGRREIRYGRIIMGSAQEKNIRKPVGFTLVELVMVMLLIMIIAAIAYPSFQKYAINARLKAAARDILGDFGNAKAQAVAENKVYEVVFNEGNNTYSIQPNGGPVIVTKSPTNFASDIRIANPNFLGGNVVSFSTRGTCTNGSVELTNSRGSKATITTTITGRAYVEIEPQ